MLTHAEIELEKNLQELNSTPMGRRAFLQAVPLLLAGACASKTADRRREGDNKGQKALSVDEERKLTQEALPQMRKEYPAIPNPELQQYLNVTRAELFFARRIVFVEGAAETEHAYIGTFAGLAREYGWYVAAGSIALPPMEFEPSKGGRHPADASKVYNTAYLFSPKGV